MTRKRSSPMGLEIYLPILLAFIMLPLLAQAAPLQDYTEIQQYTEGCYYNYNHYNEGDRIMTNEPCLNCTCHNKMLMCYLRICPFTKPIGHDCIVEKREDQCCPFITCPEVPVDVAHAAPEPGSELSFPEKFGCSIDGKFYLEGAQVPSNPNKPCELCYCIRNRTSCLIQECTLHIDGCTPIYNKGSCCPVRYNCDHENDVLELEDHTTTTEVATTTTTERPTTGFIITSTMTPTVSTACVHNSELYADGARIPGETACENCYCMRGDIICAVQECHMPMVNGHGRSCHALPATKGECCPSNYVCEDDTVTTQIIETTSLPYLGFDEDTKFTNATPVKDLHSGIPEEDLQLQTHIDEEETKLPSTKAEKEEKVTKPTETKKEGDEEVVSVTKISEEAKDTTMTTSRIQPIEGDKYVTKAPTNTGQSPESSTTFFTGTEYEIKTETPEDIASEAPIQEGDQQIGDVRLSTEETVTKVPTTADQLPENFTYTISSGEADIAQTSTEGKTEIQEFVTKTPAISDIEAKPTTISVPPEKFSEISTESTEETKPIAENEYDTSAPISEEDSSTKAPVAEQETYKFEISAIDVTKGPLEIDQATDTFEKTSTKAPLSVAEQEPNHITETPEEYGEEHDSTKVPSVETDDLSTKAPTAEEKVPESLFTEEESTTTVALERVTVKGQKLSTEQQKEIQPEEEQHEDITILPSSEEEQKGTTVSAEVSKPQFEDELSISVPPFETKKEPETSTDMLTKSEEDGIVIKAPISADKKHEYVTRAPELEEEKDKTSTDKLPTKASTYISSETTEFESSTVVSQEKESKPTAVDEERIYLTTSAPGGDHTVTPTAEDKPVFADELGSGDSSPTADEASIIVSTTEGQEKEEHVTIASGIPVKDELLEEEEKQVTTTSTEMFEESAESEEDNKLMDLTTAKPSEDQVDIITIKPHMVNFTTSSVETSKEVVEEEIGLVTVKTVAVEEATEQISTEKPEAISEFSEKSSEDISGGKVESGNVTTQEVTEYIVQQTTIAPTVDIISEIEEEQHKINHTTEQPSVIDSSMVIIKDVKTGAEFEADKEQETESTISAEISSEEETIKPFVQQSHLDKMPDMQLPSVIPGEGDCLVGHKTYQNNTIIPTSDECEIICKCISSIVTCERVKCDIPENVEKCVLDKTSTNKCCPSYICATDTLPSKAEKDEGEDTQYTTIVAPHKLPEKPIVEETEDKSKTTTVTPVLVAESVTPGISIPSKTEKDEGEDTQYTTIVAPHKLPEEPIVEETEDKSKTTTVTPVLVAESVTSGISIPSKTEKDEGEDTQYTTIVAPHKLPEEPIVEETEDKSKTTTVTPVLVAESVTSGISIPSKTEKDEGEDTQYTTIVAPHKLPEEPIVEETEDKSKTTTVTPVLVAESVTSGISIPSKTEKDEGEDTQYTTIVAPHKLPEEPIVEETEDKSKTTTVTPVLVAESVTPGISIPSKTEKDEGEDTQYTTIVAPHKLPEEPIVEETEDKSKTTTVTPVLVAESVTSGISIPSKTEKDEGEDTQYTTIVAPHKLPEEPIVEETEDKSKTTTVTPVLVAESVTPGISIPSKTEKDEGEDTQYTTIVAPHKLPEEPIVEETEDKSKTTTVTPALVAESVTPSIIIPEIQMPVASTEEPMSHIKDEEEIEQQTIKTTQIATEHKHDTPAESEIFTTPSIIVKDFAIIQPIGPVKVSEPKQQDIVTDKTKIETIENEIEPELQTGQEQPEKKLGEHTTPVFVESTTDSPMPVIPSADEYHTDKPSEKEEEQKETIGEFINHIDNGTVSVDETNITPASEEEKESKPESQTSIPTTSIEKKTMAPIPPVKEEFEPDTQTAMPTTSTDKYNTSAISPDEKRFESHTSAPSLSSFEEGEYSISGTPEDHISVTTVSTEEANKETSQESEVQTSTSSDIEKETQTVSSVAADEIHAIPPSNKDTTAQTMTEKQESVGETEISTSLPVIGIDFHTINSEEKQISSTQSLENVSDTTTTSEPSEDSDTENQEENIIRIAEIPSMVGIKDHTIEELESTSTTVSVSKEGKKDQTTPSEPLEESERMPSSTIAPLSEQEKYDHRDTIAPEESVEDLSATTVSVVSKDDKTEIDTTAVVTEEDHKQTEEQKHYTIVPETVESVTSLGEESLEHPDTPVIHDELKETSEEHTGETSTIVAPVSESENDKEQSEKQAPISITEDHIIAPISEESTEESEEKDTQTADVEEETTTEIVDTVTEEPIKFKTKIDTSSSVSHVDKIYSHSPSENISADTATTVSSPVKEAGEGTESAEEHTQASSTDKFVQGQTEPTAVEQEQAPIITPTSESESVASVAKVTVPSQKKENVTILSIEQVIEELEPSMAHTVTPTVEDDSFVTKYPIASNEYVSKDDIEYVTSGPSTPKIISSEKVSTEIVPVKEGDTISLSESDKLKPASPAEEITTSATVEVESTHAPVKQPTLDLSEEASGESEESEEEISTEPSKTQHIGEFVTESIEDATVKPSVQYTSEKEKEGSGEEDEEIKGIQFATDKLYKPSDEGEHIIKFGDTKVSTDKLPEIEITTSATKIPITEDEEVNKIPTVSEDVTVQQPQFVPSVTKVPLVVHDIEDVTTQQSEEQDLIPFVTKAPLAEQDTEDTSSQQPEEPSITKASISTEDIDHITAYESESEEKISGENITTQKPKYESISSTQPHIEDKDYITKVSTAAEGIENVTAQQLESEESISYVTKSPITIENITAQQFGVEDTSIVTVPTKESEEEEDEDLEQVTTKQAEEQDISSFTKSPIVADEISHVTTEGPKESNKIQDEKQISSITQSSIAPEVSSITIQPDETPEIEVTTSKLPTVEEADKTEELIIQTPENNIETATSKQPEENAVSHTFEYIDKVEKTTTKPSEEVIETLDVTKAPEFLEEIEYTTKLPAQKTDESFHDTADQTPTTETKKETEDELKVPTMPEQESSKFTTKLPELPEHITESSTKVAELEEAKKETVESHMTTDKQHEPVVTDVQTKLAEMIEEYTEMPVDVHISTDIFAEHITELPNKDIKTKEETHEDATILPVIGEVSTDKLPEYISELPTASVELKEETESSDEITELSLDVTKIPEIVDHVTSLPTKHVKPEEVEKSHEKPTEISTDTQVSTVKLPEHTEETTELLMEGQASSEKLPEQAEHVTELPIKGSVSEEEQESHEKSSEIPTALHVTELPAESNEQEEGKESNTESAELPEHGTKLLVKEAISETTILPIDGRVTEMPTKDIESEEGTESHQEITKLPVAHQSTEKLPEHVTELPTKDVEKEEQSHELALDLQKISTKDTATEDEATKLPIDTHVSTDKFSELTGHVTELPTKDVKLEDDVHKEVTELPIVAHDVPALEQAVDQSSESVSTEEKSTEETASEITKEIIDNKLFATTVHPLFPHLTTLPSVVIDSRIHGTNLTYHSTSTPVRDDQVYTTPTTTTTSSTTPEPVTTSAPHYQPQPPIYGQPPQYGPTQYEDEYTDEDEGEVFGPGTCRYGGKLYVSAQQIPRDDPCDFCFCFRSDIICLQQSCPPPIAGCHEEPISGFCCPRYECPVSMATVLNITTSTTTTSTTLPPHFLHHSYGNNAQRNGCLINGRSYRVGEKIESTSGPCINCTCGGDGKMKCDPQACVPEPTMQQVMAVVAAGRKR